MAGKGTKKAAHTRDDRSEALAALAANGGKIRRTAKQCGISESTLRMWAKSTDKPGRDGKPSAATTAQRDCARKKPVLAEYLDSLARDIAESIPESIPGAGLQQKATSMGILLDKAAMLRQSIVPQEAEQPIDLSRLTPEQLETLNSWLEVADRPPGGSDASGHSQAVGPGDNAGVCPVDVAGVPVGLAPPGTVYVPGQDGRGCDPEADGVHATEAREVGVGVEAVPGVLPGSEPGQRSDLDDVRGGPGVSDESGLSEGD